MSIRGSTFRQDYRILFYLVDPVIPSATNALDRITRFTGSSCSFCRLGSRQALFILSSILDMIYRIDMIVTSFILFILFIPSETNVLDMIYRIYMIVTSFILFILFILSNKTICVEDPYCAHFFLKLYFSLKLHPFSADSCETAGPARPVRRQIDI